MNPPRPNEGIDVDKAIADAVPCSCIDAYKLRGLSAPDCAYHNHAEDVKDLIARIRLETEAVVTKREREKIRAMVESVTRWRAAYAGDVSDPKDFIVSCREANQHLEAALAAYESNDAGERHAE